jgi:hypothetical protein
MKCYGHNQTGATLIIVLLLIALLHLLAIATFETALLDSRIADNMDNRAHATHATDAGLLFCLQRLQNSTAPVHHEGRMTASSTTEPDYWQQPGVFEGPASAVFEPLSAWPYTARPPQCLIEFWPQSAKPKIKMYLMTSRGFGKTTGTQAWSQSLVIFRHATVRPAAWRSIAAPPYIE